MHKLKLVLPLDSLTYRRTRFGIGVCDARLPMTREEPQRQLSLDVYRLERRRELRFKLVATDLQPVFERGASAWE